MTDQVIVGSPAVQAPVSGGQTAWRLRRWAAARTRRNTPGGHGERGTDLLWRAADELDALREALEAVERDSGQLVPVRAVLDTETAPQSTPTSSSPVSPGEVSHG